MDERVIGITSHAWDDTDCTETGGVDTRVDHYLEWIDAEMTSRCLDGTRVWCDTPGILSPPVPRSTEELLSEIELVGCSTAPGRNNPGGWALVAVGWLMARRQRAPSGGVSR